jgi:hypothetical protein
MGPFLLGKVFNVPASCTFPVKIYEAPCRSEVFVSLVNVSGMQGLDNAIKKALIINYTVGITKKVTLLNCVPLG